MAALWGLLTNVYSNTHVAQQGVRNIGTQYVPTANTVTAQTTATTSSTHYTSFLVDKSCDLQRSKERLE